MWRFFLNQKRFSDSVSDADYRALKILIRFPGNSICTHGYFLKIRDFDQTYAL